MNIDWKKYILIAADVLLAAYLVMVCVSWHKGVDRTSKCTKVIVNIADEKENGFLTVEEITKLLETQGLYPLGKEMDAISIRDIEKRLSRMPFVNTAQCYATQDNHIYIEITQRTPLVRVKSNNGDDYYIDDNGGVMPNSQYNSNIIIVTGEVNRVYAIKCMYYMVKALMANDLWKNQVVQINVLPDKTVEIVPLVGDHIVNIGQLPNYGNEKRREQYITKFVTEQLERLKTFYRLGLSQAGWNRYDYISLEFSNQIVCRKRESSESTVHTSMPKPEATPPPTPAPSNSEQEKPAEEKPQTETKNSSKDNSKDKQTKTIKG